MLTRLFAALRRSRFSDKELRAIIDAGRAASSWKNFQSYSIIVVRSKEKKKPSLTWCLKKPFGSLQPSCFLLATSIVPKRAFTCIRKTFYPEGTENLLISSVDAALAGQNTLLAAESLGYGGVIIGLVRYAASQIAELFKLPDYTYPVFGIALGTPNQNHAVKPRLPYEAAVFEEEYREQDRSTIQAYDRVQTEYAGERAKETWSQRLAAQFGQEPNQAIDQLFKEKKLEK